MSKGTSIVESYNRAVIGDDPAKLHELIDKEISAAYKKAFMDGYNQQECLKDPEGEASKLAYHHICDSSVSI